MPTSKTNPWGSTGAYGYTASAVGSKKLNPYYIPKYTQNEGTPLLDEKGRYYWDYGDPNMEASDLARMQDDGNGELTSTSGYVNINGKRFLRVGDMWEGDPSAPKPKLSFDSYGPLTYDEKYGWVADAANVKEAPRPDSWADRLGPLMPLAAFAAIAGPALAAGTTFSQAGAAAGGLGSAAPAGIGTAGLSPETIAALGTVDPATLATTLPGSFSAGAGAVGAGGAGALGAGAGGAGAAGTSLSALGGGAGPGAIGVTAADTAGLESTIAAGGSTEGLVSGTQLGSLSQTAGISAGLPSAGFTWKEGLGWVNAAGQLANIAGRIINGRYVAQTAANSANNAQLSAEDAKRRADEMAAYGDTESKLMQPWDESGGRKLAGDQLQALLRDPMGVANGDPAYKLRQQAAARAMGMYGMDSGAMGVAAADASSTWYDQRLQQLAGLAGANAAPGAGGQFRLNAMNGSAVIAGQGQASGEFANQARGNARTANLNSGLGILSALGSGISTIGNLFNNSSSGPANTQTVGPDALPPGAGGTATSNSGDFWSTTGSLMPVDTSGPPLDFNNPTGPGFNGKQPAQESIGMAGTGGVTNTGRGNFPASGAPDGGGVQMEGNPLWAPTSFSDSAMEPVMRMSSMGNPAMAGGGDYQQSPYMSGMTGMGDLLGDYLSPRGRGRMPGGARL